MAGKSLGTLTIDLIAKVGGFVSGMDKAERSSAKWRKQVESDVKAAGAAIATIGIAVTTAAVSASAAGITLLKSTSEQITETDRWAKSLRVSTQELLAWQYAAEKAGVSGDQMADIFKDIGDKIGDAVLNKSGEAVDALDALGLSADKLSKISPDKQLLAISEALSKIKTNAEKTTILESLGNDLSKLLPLFDNNSAKLKQFIEQAKDYGVAPDEKSINDLLKVSEVFQDLELQAKGLKIEIASGLAKVDLTPIQKGLDELKQVFTDPAVLEGLAKLVGGVAELVGWMGKLASESANFISRITEIPDRVKSGGWVNYNFQTGLNEKAQNLLGDISTITGPQKAPKLTKSEDYSGGPNGKQPIDSTAKKLENAFKATEQAYQRQIALIDTTGKKVVEVTELQRLQFDIADGKLAGLNETQKTRLSQLATEIDRLNSVRRANEENLKLAEFTAGLQASNQNEKASLDIDVSGGWLGAQERERMRDRLQIQADFLSRQADLQKQYQAGDITKTLYDSETQALNDALAERLQIQEDYYQQVDDLQNNGTAGFVSGLATQIEASMDLYSNMQQVGAQAFSSLTDMIIEWAETGKMNVKDFAATFIQSMGAALLQYAAAQVAMAALQAFTSMIGVPYVGPALAGSAATAAAAGAGVLMLGVSTALKGQAHDGIDSVPETGTWLLQKGERVTTAKTSAKLDATLDRVGKQSTGGQAPNINIPLEIHGDPDQRTLTLIEGAVMRGAKLGYQMTTNDLAAGTGKASKALNGGWTVGRKKR